ncbi:MAG TPA: hypothetical protein PKV76_07225 [Chitinophagales bacterium]|nr:hypothetical protein [Chitinophagales bacterium]
MKNLLKLILVMTVFSSCTPEDLVNDPESTNTPKINIVKLIRDGDTTAYTFQYNADTTKLTSVLRDGEWYATITYAANQAIIAMDITSYYGVTDSFLVKLSPNNYIDSIKSLVPELIFFGFENMNSNIRMTNNKLFESTSILENYVQSPTNNQTKTFFNMNYESSTNNIVAFKTSVRQSLFSYGYRDSVDYNTAYVNQPNLPDQFIMSTQSVRVYQGKPILNPFFLLQQSNIYPYRSHSNLISTWQTASVDFGLAPLTYGLDNYLYRYNYTFDGRSRVTQMDVTINGANYLSYQFVYFD